MKYFFLRNLKSIKMISSIILLIFFIISCSQKPMKVDEFVGFTEISPGEEALIEWSFDNADYVRVDGFVKSFSASDDFTVRPKESTKYRIIAYQDNDSIALNWRIFIKDEISSSAPQKGPSDLKAVSTSPSHEKSEYFHGIKKSDEKSIPSHLKIMRASYLISKLKSCDVRAIVLDDYGNYLSALSDKENINWNSTNFCKLGEHIEKGLEFKEKNFSQSDPNVNVGISLDNSASAEYNVPVLKYIYEFSSALDPNDQLMMSYFNHNNATPVKLMSAGKANLSLKDISIPHPSGLNALYKSAFKSIVDLGKDNDKETIYINNNRVPKVNSSAFSIG